MDIVNGYPQVMGMSMSIYNIHILTGRVQVS